MFEQLRNRLAEASKLKKEGLAIEPLRPEEIGQINLNWNSHFNTPTLRQHLQEFPGLTLRVRGHADYIVGDNWRRRTDVGQLIETSTRHYRADLVNGLLAEYSRRGYQAVILGSDEQSDNVKFYYEAGFGELERIVYYEKPDMSLSYRHSGPPLLVQPYVHSEERMADLIRVDNASFPWLWWNNRLELDYYRQQEGVTLYMAYLDGPQPRPVGYFGFTLYDRWAHLDRLAVVPEVQGKRVGAYQLSYAISLMAQRGAKRITLSTQLDNYKSQRLYEGFGFHRVKSLEYGLVGKWLGPVRL